MIPKIHLHWLRTLRLEKRLLWLLLLVWLSIPLLFSGWEYGVHVAIMVALYVLLTQSLNLVMGLAGQLVLGHAAFFGIGAYIAALLMLRAGWSFWATLPASFFGTALVGVVVGLPSLRVGGDYLGIVTLGFGEITRLILTNWVALTHGPMGLPGIPAPRLFGYEFTGKIPYFYLVTFMAAVTWFCMDRLAVSKLGLQLLALKEDELGAQVLGIHIGRLKLFAFCTSAAFAGWAGAFLASYISFISPDTFLFSDSLTILCMLVVGGMGNLGGCALGAAVLAVAPEVLRFAEDFRFIIYGVLLTVMVIYRPTGMWGLERRVLNAIKLASRRERVG